MKCFGLGLSPAVIVFLAVSESAAQNAAPPVPPAETTPTPQTTSTEAPAAPTITPPNPAAPNPTPAADSTAKPIAPAPQYQYPYPSYGYPNPYGGWGAPSQPPKELAYTAGQGIPHGYNLEERYNLGLLIAGPTLFALAYVVTVASAVDLSDPAPSFEGGGPISRPRPWDALYVPIAGPLAFANYAPGSTGFIYATEGIAQAVGVGLFLLGILRPKDVLVRKDATEAFRPTLHVGAGQMKLEMRF